MATTILTYHGSQDGIRFGRVAIGLYRRSFVFDRLTRTLRLFIPLFNDGCDIAPDTDPSRHARALAVLLEREPIVGAA